MTTHLPSKPGAVSRLCAVAAALLLVVGGSSAALAQPKQGGVLRVAERFEPVGFDTLAKKKASVYTQVALSFTHNRLFKYSPAGDVVPDLAASVSRPNATTYVVTLRKGVRFHAKPPVNGREFTSEDVKFTFERLAGSPEERLFPTLKRVTTPDRYTVQFELSAPFSAFVSNLAATTMFIYAKDAGKPTADGGRDYTSPETVIGTGPFMLKEYREKQRIVYERNPAYFESGRPYLDGVETYFIPDPSVQLAALRTGKVDIITATGSQGLPHALAAEVRSIPGARLLRQSSFQSSENVIGRLDQKPWSDLRVRQAVSMAIDRPALMKALFPEGANLISGPIPLTSRFFVAPDKLGATAAGYRHDPAAARKLLAEAGYPNGFKTKLYTTVGYGSDYLSRTELLKDMLSKIGIDASIVPQEYPVWISKTYKGDYDGMVHIPSWTLGDEDEWLATYTPGDTRNQIHINEPGVTNLVRAIREAPSDQARAKGIEEFVQMFHANLWRVFLPAPAILTVTSQRVKGYEVSLRGYSWPAVLVNVSVE
ncbi:MAG: ABC transporter substrate-binding protein [Candidatus Rokubacteria bacterium]|nr:ABC transporter substrate-binding protein [Candidatus Rokubacteria bacterium]